MEPVRTDRHDESLFDTEPSPQPERDDALPVVTPPAVSDVAHARAGAPPSDSIADGVERYTDANYIVVQRIVGFIVAGIMTFSALVGYLIVFFSADLPLFLNALIGGAEVLFVAMMGWIAWSWPPVEHRYTSYRVGPLGIELRKGVVFRRVIKVPRSRIQHTDVSQGPIERQFGLATLNLYTAGTEHSKVDLHGLKHEMALKIRDHLAVGGEDDAV